MDDWLFPLCASVAWLVLGYRVIHLLREPTLQRGLVCLLIAFPATSFTVSWPPIYRGLDELAGVPNLATLVSYSGIVLFSATSQVWLLALTHPGPGLWRRAWPRIAAFALALVAMAELFALAPIEVEAEDFSATYADTPFVPAFQLVYVAAFAAGLLGVGQLCWGWARRTDRPWLRRGLRMIALGAACGLGYCAAKVTYLVLRAAGVHQELWNDVSPLFAGLGALCFLAGFTLPSVGRAGRWAWQWRAYQRIYPLWRELTGQVPQVRLPLAQGPRMPWLAVRNLDFLLYRRVIECLDARLLLRDRIDPALAERVRAACAAAGIAGAAADAIVEAAQLRSALRTAGTPGAGVAPVAHGPDLASETQWLTRVAAAWDSPLARPAEAG